MIDVIKRYFGIAGICVFLFPSNADAKVITLICQLSGRDIFHGRVEGVFPLQTVSATIEDLDGKLVIQVAEDGSPFSAFFAEGLNNTEDLSTADIFKLKQILRSKNNYFLEISINRLTGVLNYYGRSEYENGYIGEKYVSGNCEKAVDKKF